MPENPTSLAEIDASQFETVLTVEDVAGIVGQLACDETLTDCIIVVTFRKD